MYESIRIQNFRGLKDLTIENLGRVNLLVGANNVGKTSVLEALALLHMHLDGYEITQILHSRGYRKGSSTIGALTGMVGERGPGGFTVGIDDGPTLKVTASGEQYPGDGQLAEYSAQLDLIKGEALRMLYYSKFPENTTNPNGSTPRKPQLPLPVSLDDFPAFPSEIKQGHFGNVAYLPVTRRLSTSELADLLTNDRERGRVQQVVKSLRNLDDRIRDVYAGWSAREQLPTATVSMEVPLQQDLEPLSMNQLGEGARRLVEIGLLLPRAANGLGLVDEIDAGIYHESLETLWTSIGQVADVNRVQILATTHSWECVVAALAAFDHDPEAFRLVRLERDSTGVRAIVAKHHQVGAAQRLGLEVR